MALPDGISRAMSAIWRSSFLREAPQPCSSHYGHVADTRWSNWVLPYFWYHKKYMFEMCPPYQQFWNTVGLMWMFQLMPVCCQEFQLLKSTFNWVFWKFKINQTIKSSQANRLKIWVLQASLTSNPLEKCMGIFGCVRVWEVLVSWHPEDSRGMGLIHPGLYGIVDPQRKSIWVAHMGFLWT